MTFDDPDFGRVAEAAMFAQTSNNIIESETKYLRERSNRRDWEVDLIHLDHSRNPIWLAEIKWSERKTELQSAAKVLLHFGKKYKLGKEVLYCTTKNSYGPEND